MVLRAALCEPLRKVILLPILQGSHMGYRAWQQRARTAQPLWGPKSLLARGRSVSPQAPSCQQGHLSSAGGLSPYTLTPPQSSLPTKPGAFLQLQLNRTPPLSLCKAPSFLSVKSTAWPPGCLTWLGFLSDLGSLHPSPALVRPQGLCTCCSCSFSTHHVSFRSFLYGHFARLFPVTDLRWHFRHLQSLCPDTFLCSTCPQLASGVYFVLG